MALTAAEKAELKQVEQKALAATKLKALNDQRAATQATNYARNLAGNVQDIGRAAVAGGKFIDTSAASGYQSPVTAQMTSYLKGTIKDPFAAARQAAIKNRLRVSTKGYRKELNQAITSDYLSAIKDVRTGGSAGGSRTLGSNDPEPSTGPYKLG